jgi:hypothetical protein
MVAVAWEITHSVETNASPAFAWNYWTEVTNWDDPPAKFELDGPFACGSRGTTRSSLLEEQQHLTFTRAHCAATLAEFFDNAKPKCLLVKTDGARYIAHVQRRFKNAIRFRHNASWLSI